VSGSGAEKIILSLSLYPAYILCQTTSIYLVPFVVPVYRRRSIISGIVNDAVVVYSLVIF